jgi:hypothetical protein
MDFFDGVGSLKTRSDCYVLCWLSVWCGGSRAFRDSAGAPSFVVFSPLRYGFTRVIFAVAVVVVQSLPGPNVLVVTWL